jgi:hypothetical protein
MTVEDKNSNIWQTLYYDTAKFRKVWNEKKAPPTSTDIMDCAYLSFISTVT